MKKLLVFSALFMTILVFPSFRSGGDKPAAATELRKLKNESFKRGELLKYRLHYGIVDAGVAEVEVTDEAKSFNDRPTLHVVGKGYSKGAFNLFYKVNDRYESYIDEQSLAPVVFLRKVNEGGYKINQNQVYDHEKQKVLSNGTSFDIPEYTQDMISAFYFARTLDMSQAKAGDEFSVKSFIDNEIWELKIKYIGKETISTAVGKVKCLKFRPIVQKGRVFKKSEDLNVWISDDKNHIPVRAQADVLVGSVKMDLSSYSNLANPLALE